MAPASRFGFGTALLGTFGLALAALMAYTLAFDGFPDGGPEGPPAAEGASRVAVFFPDRRDWCYFVRGVEACVARGLATSVSADEGSITVETAGRKHRVRFDWHGIRGVGETGDEARRLLDDDPRPVALVGSSTTVLTVALAEALAEAKADGPPLLVPWATSVAGNASRPLLEIAPDRTFRYCPNNRQLAESVVDCLREQESNHPPARVFLVVDPHDPYSRDLARCFRKAIGAHWPALAIEEHPDALGVPTIARSPGAALVPSPLETDLADAIWSAADALPETATTWAVLPLQGEPARRVIAALQRRASWRDPLDGKAEAPPRVICGDGVGRETLNDLAGHRPFPIWCASTSSTRSPDHGVSNDTQTLAEIASSVILALDRSPGDVRGAIANMKLSATDRAAFGRPLSFEPSGERQGDPGHVLAVRPGSDAVLEFDLDERGRWAPFGDGR